MEKFTSKITRAKCPAQLIYNRFESLEGLSSILHHEKIDHVEASRDECQIAVKGIGPIGVKVDGREPFKTLKYTSTNGKPIAFTVWLQLVEVSSQDTRIRLTLHADIPLVLRFMLKKKLQSGLDQAADQIASAFSF